MRGSQGGDGAPIATTANAELQALGTGGQLALQAWDQLVSYLRRAHGDAHAALFAEPNPDPDRGLVDWYDPLGSDGPAQPIAALPEAERAQAEAELARLVAAIAADAARLAASPREGDRFLGTLLGQALQVPDGTCRRAIGARPVLIAWGHARADGRAEPALILGARAVASGPARFAIIGPPGAAAMSWPIGWIAAALLALLGLALALLLLWTDPWRWFEATPPVCVVDPANAALLAELRQEQDRESALRAEIARLARGLGERRVACPPPAAAAPPVPVPAPAPAQSQPTEDAARARAQGAASGRVQVILAWDDSNDLDLVVACPDGAMISYQTPRGCNGGALDVDRNAAPPARRDPVENIVWAADPPRGAYAIHVVHSGNIAETARASRFRVTLRIDGRPDRSFTGEVAPGGRAAVGTFEIPAR